MEDLPETVAETEAGATDYITLTADLVSAYVSNNSIPTSELPGLLSSVYAALSGLTRGRSAATAKNTAEKLTPAQIKKSITPDTLISFEDGKSYKALRRHLRLRGLTPETYRAKHGLPADYPMTSASYSAQRSELARATGLGSRRKAAAKAAEPDEALSEAPAKPKQKAGRPRKAS